MSTLIEMPSLDFTIKIPDSAHYEIWCDDGEEDVRCATFTAKFTDIAYVESQVHARAKAMRRVPGEYTVKIEKLANPQRSIYPANTKTSLDSALAEAKAGSLMGPETVTKGPASSKSSGK